MLFDLERQTKEIFKEQVSLSVKKQKKFTPSHEKYFVKMANIILAKK